MPGTQGQLTQPALSLAFSFTANAGMVSDEELEQMLDSGQSEVFVSNVSGRHQAPSAGPPILSESFKKKKKLFIFSCAGSSLLCRPFSSCSEQGLFSSCGAWASPCSGFS